MGALAADLDSPERCPALDRGLGELRERSVGLAYVSEAVHALAAELDIAWRAFARSLLAEELGGGD